MPALLRAAPAAPRRAVAAALLLLAAQAVALAGGGPQNVLLVVNARSAGSKAVANHYVRLRGLPAANVLYLDYDGDLESVPVDEFREKVLEPVLKTIDSRKLSAQIDTVAYSTDFPWKIGLRGAFDEGREFSKSQSPTASLTGATYLYGFTLFAPEGLLLLDSNWYVPSPGGVATRGANLLRCRSINAAGARAFRSAYSWTAEGKPTIDREQGRRYLMSTSLGVTTGRGLSVGEVIASLRRAAEADADPPDGAFYFLRNGNVRSVTRHGCYEAAATALRAAGAKAEVQQGVLPTGATDVAGLMTGAADLPLGEAGLRFQPGAIAEHLTSYGGMLADKPWQTPLTDLIRAGATGSCGTVDEPTAVQAKFPLPTLQVHYRRGASLAEAFYLSVAAPYQLLIVGDPLCQPWAKRPTLQLTGWPGPAEGSLEQALDELNLFGLNKGALGPAAKPADTPESEPGTDGLAITATVAPPGGGSTGFYELYVDGRLALRKRAGDTAELGDEQLRLGWQELRCVGVAGDPFQAQRIEVGSIERLDPERGVSEPTRLVVESTDVALGEPLEVSASAAGATRIAIRQNAREVGSIDGASGSASLSTDELGAGPVRLQAVAEPSGAASRPVWVEVQ
ncbi:TIGR03790 family protein [Botrimarina sp.]|uniref:TIGR03790 family protein n=1 Tax=Botrimarina sp. TaxID=2795802 RepID=UPI0032EFD749